MLQPYMINHIAICHIVTYGRFQLAATNCHPPVITQIQPSTSSKYQQKLDIGSFLLTYLAGKHIGKNTIIPEVELLFKVVIKMNKKNRPLPIVRTGNKFKVIRASKVTNLKHQNFCKVNHFLCLKVIFKVEETSATRKISQSTVIQNIKLETTFLMAE